MSAPRIIAAAVACTALFFSSSAGTARAAGPDCPSSVMYIAAHADDTLLFQSPSLLQDVRSGRCVRTVFLTAGDAGKPAAYWEGREKGAEAGYAQMLGVTDDWSSSQVVADGHSIRLETLDAQPRISIAYLRLPDGGPAGAGTPAYGDESLTKLWKDGSGEPGPTIDEIEAVDGTETYDYAELIDTLAGLIDSFTPTQLPTQDYTLNFAEGDHADHVATGYFVEAASELYEGSHRLLAFQGYDSADRVQNVFGNFLLDKSLAFYAYGAHDSDACADESHCADTPYAKWLKREYIEDTETRGAVAHSGYPQETTSGSFVSLDGSESSGESGDGLAYAWTQTSGTPVALSGAATAMPSFVAPPHAAVLGFSLIVSDGPAISEPDFATVAVDGPEPPPPDPPSPAADPGGEPPVAHPIQKPGPVKSKVKLSTHKVRLLVGKASRHVVRILGAPRPWVECRGTLPPGASCQVTASRNVIVEGSKGIKRPGTFRLTVQITDQGGTVRRPLIVQVRRSGGR